MSLIITLNGLTSLKLTQWQQKILLKYKKSLFATHGIPKIIRADNIPFIAFQLNNFAKEYAFCITTSILCTLSKGFERYVGIAKNML